MIVQLGKELDEIFDVLDLKKDDVSKEQAMQVMSVLFQAFNNGYSVGVERAVHIVQKMAINPQPIVREIRKPIR